MTEILHAGRTVTDDVIAYDISWDGDLATTGTVVWSMQVTSEDAAETLQLAYEVVDGAFSAQFALDLASGRRTDVDEDTTLEAHEITARFPADIVGVAAQWPSWKAVLSVDGAEVAEHLAIPAT